MSHSSPVHDNLMLTQDHSTELGHTQPVAIYLNIFFILLILTAVTIAVSFLDFGMFDLVVAMVIASIKASLVALFFMHLKYESPFTWTYALIPLLLLFFLIGGVFIDEPLRTEPPLVKVDVQSK